MFKLITTLIRGRAADAEQAFTDANALPILRQQLRDASNGLEKARRAVAVVMAYNEREKKNAAVIAGKLSDLEMRTLDALEQGQDELAHEAATAIAELEYERDVSVQTIATYEAEIKRLREDVSLAEQRLRCLKRGQHLAEATSKTQKLRGTMPDGVIASLKEAEETLARLQSRQNHADLTEEALAELSAQGNAATLSERMAAAGCGPRKKTDAETVLERLKAKTAKKSA